MAVSTHRCATIKLEAAILLIASSAEHAATCRVYALPGGTPDHGIRVTRVEPQDRIVSPFGWHGSVGVAGPEFTTLQGNNVQVYMGTLTPTLPSRLEMIHIGAIDFGFRDTRT